MLIYQTKHGYTKLKLFSIFYNLHKVKIIKTGSNTYIQTSGIILTRAISALSRAKQIYLGLLMLPDLFKKEHIIYNKKYTVIVKEPPSRVSMNSTNYIAIYKKMA